MAGELTGENLKIGQNEPTSPTMETVKTDKGKDSNLNPEGSNFAE
jgi:hypothetical protein